MKVVIGNDIKNKIKRRLNRMEKSNYEVLRKNELSFRGNEDNLNDAVSDIKSIVGRVKTMSKDDLEKELVQLIINNR